MKNLVIFILITISTGLFSADTTTVYRNYKKKKVKKEKAQFVQKIVEQQDGLWFESLLLIDGTIQRTGTYTSKKMRIRSGHFSYYSYAGFLEKEGNYLDDQKDGEWKTYYSTGELKRKGVYKNGEKENNWTEWYVNGKVYKTGSYIDGNNVDEWNLYYDDGSPFVISNYDKEGNASGTHVSYYTDGTVSDTGLYEKDMKVGEWRYYYENGQMSCLATLENGVETNVLYWNNDGSVLTKTSKVNSNPSFPGGESKMYKFLGDNMKYPSYAVDNNIQGRVWVSFVVNRDGSVGDVKILRGIHHSIDIVSVEIVKTMPTWIPAIDHNRPVRVRFNLPILFKLK